MVISLFTGGEIPKLGLYNRWAIWRHYHRADSKPQLTLTHSIYFTVMDHDLVLHATMDETDTMHHGQ